MTTVSKARNVLEGLVREGSFKWLIKNRTPFDEDFEEMGESSSSGRSWVSELSPLANVVVRRCSKIMGMSTSELQDNFNADASDSIKHPQCYARNLLEYISFRALALSTQVIGYLEDKKFRRLTFYMMLAWEVPAASSQPFTNVDDDLAVGMDAFCRIASAVPIIADVVTSGNLFEVLASSSGGRLQFSVYEKYLNGLKRAIRKFKSNSESSLLSNLRSDRAEKIMEVDGTVTSQPVLEHIGISAWPGRLILTDHALYFEALLVVSYDNAKRYDLSDDLKQVVKPELTGPLGTRLFDKAVFYKSLSLGEPVIMEFPELKGHSRRDYWLAIIKEILYAHRFIKKFRITGIERDESLLKATLGILRLQALRDLSNVSPVCCETLLLFNLCDQLPGGDVILETLANMSSSRELEQKHGSKSRGMYSISALTMASNLGFVFGTSPPINEGRLAVGDISVGETTALERAIKESRRNHKKVVMAQASVDGVKVEGIDTNLAVMKELLSPLVVIWQWLVSLAYWEDPMKSSVFCLICSFVILRGWICNAIASTLVFLVVFMALSRCFNNKGMVDELKVSVPPVMNAVEQLLGVQNVITQAEEIIQDGNIVLLKLRGLLMSVSPQASQKFSFALLTMALILAILPIKFIVVFTFLGAFTSYSPWRKDSSDRWIRRMREWWFSIPAAPVVLVKEKRKPKRGSEVHME
ncbi:uncharacterized protein LOC124918409 [Impatiens glandulifera]|uniref:uncharacterized protein LOC124918409 n=1 Tax=Impatiens glandulifera TaxID=253017 RepID=UPI001FB0FC36|nr:uncharacterized protein LOC124918409 [Impatiens glandulifera]